MVYDSQTETFSVHQGVLDRVRVEKEAAAIKREESAQYIKPEPESDVDMESGPVAEDELDDFEDLEHSEELQQLRALKMKQRELRTQLKSEKVVEDQEMSLEAIRRVSAREALRANYTVLVVDTNFILSSLELFKLMLEKDEWSVVIPNTGEIIYLFLLFIYS